MIDLHIHTTCSDGQFSPEETIRMGHCCGKCSGGGLRNDLFSGH